MRLELVITNVDRLPNGGPLSVHIDDKGLDIGRDCPDGWSLPDPNRFISAKHCEVRFQDGAFDLVDTSRNGTFLNGAEERMASPHRLRDGDELLIFPYVIGVRLDAKATGTPIDEEGRIDVSDATVFVRDPVEQPAASSPGAIERTGLAAAGSGARVDADQQSDEATSNPFLKESAAAGDGGPRRGVGAEAAAHASTSPPTGPRRAMAAAPDMTLATQAHDTAAAVLERIADAAGLPPGSLSGRGTDEAACDIGAFLRIVALNLSQLLASRASAKAAMRVPDRTLIAMMDNNPLKFSGSPQEALQVMFGPSSGGFLDAAATLEKSFADLKDHQVQIFSAMQAAIEELHADLAPDRIEEAVGPEQALGLATFRKARLWDAYVERWQSKTTRRDRRLVDTFMQLFSKHYERSTSSR